MISFAGYIVKCTDILKAMAMYFSFYIVLIVTIFTFFYFLTFFLKSYHLTPWRDSISRPIALLVAGGVDTTRPRRQGIKLHFLHPTMLSRVARFFFVQHTKMGKNIPK
jgi:hypothetical protein